MRLVATSTAAVMPHRIESHDLDAVEVKLHREVTRPADANPWLQAEAAIDRATNANNDAGEPPAITRKEESTARLLILIRYDEDMRADDARW